MATEEDRIPSSTETLSSASKGAPRTQHSQLPHVRLCEPFFRVVTLYRPPCELSRIPGRADRLVLIVMTAGFRVLVTLRRLHLSLLGTALTLGIAACGTAGVSTETATVNSSGSGEGVATGSGIATLIWAPVTLNTDGTPLTDLAGYKVFYGPSASTMNTIVVLSDPSLTTYVVSTLSSGTWYFGVVAYTTSGTQSAMSNLATKAIN